jgi:hypothetical protein
MCGNQCYGSGVNIPGSRIRIFPYQIQDQKDFGSRIQIRVKEFNSVADPDPGSGIGYLFDPWIRDPGWKKVSFRIRDPG